MGAKLDCANSLVERLQTLSRTVHDKCGKYRYLSGYDSRRVSTTRIPRIIAGMTGVLVVVGVEKEKENHPN